jgi:hypothetical protein
VNLKLDENLNERSRDLLVTAGHDVSTVTLQGLQAAADEDLINTCRREGRALVTMDLDLPTRCTSRLGNTLGSPCCACPRKPPRRTCSKPSRPWLRDWSEIRWPVNYGLSKKAVSASISTKIRCELASWKPRRAEAVECVRRGTLREDSLLHIALRGFLRIGRTGRITARPARSGRTAAPRCS